jgi:hypothetical protein
MTSAGIPRAQARSPFAKVLFDGWTPAELAAVPLPEGGEVLAAVVAEAEIPLPAGALALFIELRGRMHGLVMLELLGRLYPFDEVGERFFAGAMGRMSDELDALRAGS